MPNQLTDLHIRCHKHRCSPHLHVYTTGNAVRPAEITPFGLGDGLSMQKAMELLMLVFAR